MSDLAQESIAGIRVLKIFVQEQAFGRRFADKNRDYSDRNLSLAKTFGFFFPAVGFLAGLTSLIFLLLGGRSVMEGSLSPGMFTAFFAYLQMLIWPMLGAGFTVNLLQRAGASLGRINKILAEQPDIASPPPAQARRGPLRGDIRLHAALVRLSRHGEARAAGPGAGHPGGVHRGRCWGAPAAARAPW